MLRRFAQNYAPRLFSTDPSLLATFHRRGLKETTGLVGLAVDPNGRSNLRQSLRQILQSIKAVPEDAGYRQWVEATVKYRLGVVESQLSDEDVERDLDFQLEVLIKQSKDELGLIPFMLEHKPWEVPEGYKVPFEVEEYVEDSVKLQPNAPNVQPGAPPPKQGTTPTQAPASKTGPTDKDAPPREGLTQGKAPDAAKK